MTQHDPFQTMVRNLEAKLSVARDNLRLYEGLYKKWRDDVHYLHRMLEETREAAKFYDAGRPEGVPMLRIDAPKAAEAEVEPHEPAPFLRTSGGGGPHASPAGLNRHLVARRLSDWHTHLPLPRSYKAPSSLARQAVAAEIRCHPDYAGYVKAGNPHVSGRNTTVQEVNKAAKALGIDIFPVLREAHSLHADIAYYGEQGVDYLWGNEA